MANEPPNEAGGRPAEAGSQGAPAAGHPAKDDHIRERAYLIWVDEGRPHGRDLDHWLRAKWELERQSGPKG
jgi:Protein of unknown function (DUF2934)